eukprot:3264861-Pyramimonas_sp.AAC.1
MVTELEAFIAVHRDAMQAGKLDMRRYAIGSRSGCMPSTLAGLRDAMQAGKLDMRRCGTFG